MLEYFYKGGPIFMGILTALLLSVLVISLICGFQIFSSKNKYRKQAGNPLKLIRDLGLIAFVTGLLGQLIGLFSAFRAIELEMVEASPSLIAAGFKVSMISSLYGLIIYLISLGIWFTLQNYQVRKQT